jgi:tetratricopeptide (TPR) repeat protein
MADTDRPVLPQPSPEHRKVAVGQFERAQQVTAKGDFDYGIQLLLNCCKLDPANLTYRRYLRQVEKTKYKNNLRGSALALLSTSPAKAKIKATKRSRDYLKVLEYGEEVLTKNPWDTGTQMDMAEAADALGLLDVAAWILEQARQKNPKDATVNRALARLYEKRGNFNLAIMLWEMVREVAPTDVEAQHKAKDLAACDTIARGQYEQVVAGQPPAPRPGSDPGVKLPAVAGPGDPATTKADPADRVRDRLVREVEPLRARIVADPTNPNTYLHLANLYRRADQFDQARAVLQEGLGPTGNHFDLVGEIADLETETFRRNLAVTDEKLKKRPQDAELLKLHHELQKEVNAREMETFRRKADRYPTDKSFRLELGVRLYRAGQLDEAIRELQALRGDQRYQWKVLMYLGYCFKARNNWRLAQRNFEDALQSVPASETEARKEILLQLARGCAESGDLSKAVDVGLELANLDFGYGDIGRLLDDWQARLQET